MPKRAKSRSVITLSGRVSSQTRRASSSRVLKTSGFLDSCLFIQEGNRAPVAKATQSLRSSPRLDASTGNCFGCAHAGVPCSGVCASRYPVHSGA